MNLELEKQMSVRHFWTGFLGDAGQGFAIRNKVGAF
jgi:hypothetical protein